MASLSLPDHCISTFKYFLPVCVRTFQAEQIKNTKTILRVYIHDTEGVYRRLSTAKNTAKIIKHEIFAALASTNAGRKIAKRRKKMNFPLR
jgi:hypothetical protein